MRAIKYFAPQVLSTWGKTGYLFENGIFLCEFQYYNVSRYICRKYDFGSPPEKVTFGKGLVNQLSDSTPPGALGDYQTFEKKEEIEKDFELMKSHLLERKVKFWPESNHQSIELNQIE